MKRILIAVAMLSLLPIAGPMAAYAQSMDDLNLQVHGYATQGFIYSTNNNWNTTDSTDGSAAWTEAVVNLTAQPQPKLRIGVQARYSLLGTYGNTITLDWAQVDLKVNEKFGFRVGKVKTPAGLLNEIQDIDPAYLWILLPQSVYPLASRDSILAHFGGVVYGDFPLGESLGKLEYQGFGGQRVLASDDGFLQTYRDNGINFPSGTNGQTFGGTLDWGTPIHGLMVGASEVTEHDYGVITSGPLQGTSEQGPMHIPLLFTRYERSRWMLAGEYSRLDLQSSLDFPGAGPILFRVDQRQFYGMASYRITSRLDAGIYYSSVSDHQAPISSARYQKDWALSGRYDFNPYLYLKVEQHFVDGTAIGFRTSDNTGGLKPDTRMTLLKLGVSF